MKRIEEKQQFDNVRPALIWGFILALAGVGAVEILLMSLINRFVLPLMANIIWSDVDWQAHLTNTAMLAFLGMLLLELLVIAIGSFLPSGVKPLIYSMSEGIEEAIYQKVPEFRHSAVTQMDVGRGILLFGMLLLILVILILPISIAAGWYSRLVTREIGHIEKLREEQYIETDRQRNLMLSDIAHDLRTPITTVNGYAKALHDGMVKDEDKKQEYLEAIMSKSSRMEELINLLFEYSKLNSAGFALHLEKGDLAELVRENIALIYDNVENAGMELDIIIPEYYCEVNFDRVQLSRVITNLINNAIKHNERGTKICVSLRWDNYDEKYVIVIADDGDPIPPEVSEHLFEPFAVGDASRSSKGGSGLGLSISAKIVEMHGGNISVREKILGYTKAFVVELYPTEH